jgi:hypothetical protein
LAEDLEHVFAPVALRGPRGGGVHGFCLGVGRAVASATTSRLKLPPSSTQRPASSRLGEKRLAAGEKVVDPTGDPLVCARRAVIDSTLAVPDGPELDDLSELGDRLEQGTATGTQIADQVVRTYRAVQARLAGHALKWGTRPPLVSVTGEYI